MMVSAISLDICHLVVVLFQSLPKVNNSACSPEEDSHWPRLTLRGPWRAGTPLHGGSLGPICGDGDSWGPAGTWVGTSSSGAHSRAGWSGAGLETRAAWHGWGRAWEPPAGPCGDPGPWQGWGSPGSPRGGRAGLWRWLVLSGPWIYPELGKSQDFAFSQKRN